MKFRVYSTTKDSKVFDALEIAKDYFSDVIFADLEFVKIKERSKSLYETVLSWALNILRPTTSIKTVVIEELDNEGYDGTILFLDKSKTKEDEDLFGQHTFKNGKAYIEIYNSNRYYRMKPNGTKFVESYVTNRIGSLSTATTHSLLHEIFHALSYHYKVSDRLHYYIEEGQFDSYKKYLDDNKKVLSNADLLYLTALKCLNKDVTPDDVVDDEFACAAQVNAVYKKAFGEEIGGGASTYNLYKALVQHRGFRRTDNPKRGDIVISPTGYQGVGGTLPHGHVAIMGENGIIMSNNSLTGLFEENYTVSSWIKKYVEKGKFPMFYFTRI